MVKASPESSRSGLRAAELDTICPGCLFELCPSCPFQFFQASASNRGDLVEPRTLPCCESTQGAEAPTFHGCVNLRGHQQHGLLADRLAETLEFAHQHAIRSEERR